MQRVIGGMRDQKAKRACRRPAQRIIDVARRHTSPSERDRREEDASFMADPYRALVAKAFLSKTSCTIIMNLVHKPFTTSVARKLASPSSVPYLSQESLPYGVLQAHHWHIAPPYHRIRYGLNVPNVRTIRNLRTTRALTILTNSVQFFGDS